MTKLVKIAALVSLTWLLATATALAGGDAEMGKKAFKKCKSCHMVGPKAKRKVGPVLNDIFGATAGTNEEFGKKYSKAMRKAGEDGLVWNEETIAEFLAKPKAMIKKIKMSFSGFKKPEDIDNVIAYLITFSPDYTPDVEEEAEKKEEANTSG
jgi:cytochrome c2